MKVLVFDDTPVNRTSAEVTLKGHELTVVGTYDEAQNALISHTDYAKQREIMESLFGDFNPYRATEEEKGKKEAYRLAEKKALADCTTQQHFDVVLTDLMVPASAQHLGDRDLAGKEMPLGSIIALLAISNGVKKVAVVTDLNHHKHPASAAFDCFRGNGKGDIKVLCTNSVNSASIDEKTLEVVDEKFLETPEGKAKYPGDWNSRRGLIRGKNWGQILNWLTKEE